MENVSSTPPCWPGESGTLVTLNWVEGWFVGLGETTALRVTLPVKPKLTRVKLEFPEELATKLAEAELGEIVKSASTVTVTVVELVTLPLVADTVTVYVPAGVEAVVVTFSLAPPDPPEVRVTLVTLRVGFRPLTLVVDVARVTVPAKPLALVRVMVDIEKPPAVMLVGLAAVADMSILAFGGMTETAIKTWCVNPPLEPFTKMV